jgi:hypothetical protein
VDSLVIGDENPILSSGLFEENVIESRSRKGVDDANDVPAEAKKCP